MSALCRVLGVSRSGYYGWRDRVDGEPVGRAAADREALAQIRAVHDAYGYYGSPRVHQELLARGCRIGRHRVARLMRCNGIRARRGRLKSRPRSAPPARRPEIGDLVQRDFHADVPNALWFTDLTMIRTGQGWLYAAVVLDAFSRQVVGYTVAATGRPPAPC